MPAPMVIRCSNCEESFNMETFEAKCPNCDMTYGVTPCHSHDPESVQAAGIDY
jgi:Zn finger protein HypA/HybF involved in hydrogenase expression